MNSKPASLPPSSARPLDWGHAVRAAASRLKAQHDLPETENHPLLAAEAQCLAALMCAYGKFAPEAERPPARAAEPLPGRLPVHRPAVP